MSCIKCRTPCPLHGILECGTCHKHPGDCDMGDCTDPGVDSWVFRVEGRVVEVRTFCTKHSTDPAFGWLRKGATLEVAA